MKIFLCMIFVTLTFVIGFYYNNKNLSNFDNLLALTISPYGENIYIKNINKKSVDLLTDYTTLQSSFLLSHDDVNTQKIKNIQLLPESSSSYYPQLYYDFFRHEKLKRVSIIGVGLGTLGISLAQERDDIKVNLIDINPTIISSLKEIHKDYQKLEENGQLFSYAEDGRNYVNDLHDKQDIFLVDVYNGLTEPSHMTTVEFFKEIRGKLNENGILLVNLHASLSGKYKRKLESSLKTIKASGFEYIEITPCFNEGLNINTIDPVFNVIIFASNYRHETTYLNDDNYIKRNNIDKNIKAKSFYLENFEYNEDSLLKNINPNKGYVLSDNFITLDIIK